MTRLFILLLLCAPMLLAGDPEEPKPAKKPLLQEMVLIKDAKTGKLRKPTETELKLLMPHNPLSRSDEGLTITKNKKGDQMIDLQGRYQHAVMAIRDANGKLVIASCVGSEKEAKAFMEAAAKKKAQEKKIYDQ